MKSHCTPSMLKSKLIKLIFFERKEVKLLYIGATGFRSHTSSAIFEPVLCLLCLYYAHYTSTRSLLCLCYAYYACTMPTMPATLTMPVQCLCYASTRPTMPVLCPLCLYYAYYACTIPTMPTMPVLCLYYAYYAYL